jgi:hypothetical protein
VADGNLPKGEFLNRHGVRAGGAKNQVLSYILGCVLFLFTHSTWITLPVIPDFI